MIKSIFIFFSVILLSCDTSLPLSYKSGIDFIEISQNMLQALKEGRSTDEFEKAFAELNEDELSAHLHSDAEKITFWINVYNAYIQIALKKNPEKYEKRNQFFSEKFINIGGRILSFSNIEHGIIRRSQWAYGLGIISNPFAPKYQKKYRPSKKEPRIHFALNCGAKSCPPVTIYSSDQLDSQLDLMAKRFLSQNTSYDSESNIVTTTTLFSWFRGDFGGKKGIIKMLKNYDVIKSTDVKLKFGSYDWSLLLDNYSEVEQRN